MFSILVGLAVASDPQELQERRSSSPERIAGYDAEKESTTIIFFCEIERRLNRFTFAKDGLQHSSRLAVVMMMMMNIALTQIRPGAMS